MVSIRRRILLRGKLIQEQFIRTLQDHEDRLTVVEGGEAGELLDISSLKETVGDADSGLVKDVTGLKTTVGDADNGLVKEVNTLKTSKANSSHTHSLSNISDLETVEAVITYTDNSTATILLVKQSSS